MATIGALQTLVTWAKQAFNSLTGAAGALTDAAAALWHYVTSLYNLLSWLIGVPQLRYVASELYALATIQRTLGEISQALRRLPGWILLVLIVPLANLLQREINANMARTLVLIGALRALVFEFRAEEIAYTRQLFTIEAENRLKGDHVERVAMLASVAAALATVQQQAASGYNSGLHNRLGTIGKIIDQIAENDPAVKAITKDLVQAVFDLETIDDPVLRFVIATALKDIVGHLGVDNVIGDLVSSLLDTVTDQAKAKGLSDVTRDVSGRLNALEAQWASFMAHGGSEVEQAGDEWHALGTVLVDVGILGLFGLAVTDPGAWATGMADTIGIVGNDTLDAVFGLISKI